MKYRFYPETRNEGQLVFLNRTPVWDDTDPEVREAAKAALVARAGFVTEDLRELLTYLDAQGYGLVLSSSFEDGRPPERHIIGVKPRPRHSETDRLTLSCILEQSGPLTVDQAYAAQCRLWHLDDT